MNSSQEKRSTTAGGGGPSRTDPQLVVVVHPGQTHSWWSIQDRPTAGGPFRTDPQLVVHPGQTHSWWSIQDRPTAGGPPLLGLVKAFTEVIQYVHWSLWARILARKKGHPQLVVIQDRPTAGGHSGQTHSWWSIQDRPTAGGPSRTDPQVVVIQVHSW